jgi:hypothetical protein
MARWLEAGSRVGGEHVSAVALMGGKRKAAIVHDGNASKNGVETLSFRRAFH